MSRPYKKAKGAVGATKYSSPCKFFLRGSCSNQRCPYLHVRNQTTIRSSGHKEEAVQQGNGAIKLLSTMLKLFFEKQTQAIYSAESGMLNLSRLAAYDDLASVASSINFNTRTFCVALCTCIRELVTPPPAVLQLDHNGIKGFHHLGKALEEAELHVPLRALSLAHNELTSVDIAHELRHFSNLAELNLIGNPVTENTDYRLRFKKHVPWLQGLDGASLAAPPPELPWPRFFDPTHVPSSVVGSSTLPALSSGVRGYDSAQKALLHFIQTAVLNPLEMEPAPGVLTGVDAVSDVYALNSSFTFSLVSNDAAVSTPSRTAGGGAASAQRDVVREIVGFRMRQTESSHNVLMGLKSATVAMGRTSVCAKLEHVLYPKNFVVGHYIHDSPDVAVLDNKGFGPNAVVGMKQPLSVATLHGVMLWRYRTSGSDADVQHGNLMRDAIVIKRNFSRVLTVASADPGRWHIVNDMVTLYPFRGGVEEDASSSSSSSHNTGVTTAPLTAENVLYRDVHPYDVVFSPATDPKRAALFGRRYRVPAPIVATLCSVAHSDRELAVMLLDLTDVPMTAYEQCAAFVDMDPIASIFLCRIGNRFGLEPVEGVALLRKCGLDWAAIVKAIGN